MHEHCEIIIPPTDDIEDSVKRVMAQFDENATDEIRDHAFWDWYVIGGRWAGTKLIAGYDKSKLEEFHAWLRSEHVTVSSLQCGKQELNPPSQIPKVDEKWNEMFPHTGGVMVACPLFAHSNDRYGRNGRGTIEGDICQLKDAMAIKCCRVIFGGPSHSTGKDLVWEGPIEPKFMLCESQWNGLNHMPVAWDQTVRSAVDEFRKNCDGYREEYAKVIMPKDDWLAVTVDYHT